MPVDGDSGLSVGSKDITAFASQVGLVVLTAKSASKKARDCDFEWDAESSGWKEFLQSMQKAGAKSIALFIDRVDPKEVQRVSEIAEELLADPEYEDDQADFRDELAILKKLRGHESDIGAINLVSVVDGSRWLYRSTEGWFLKWEEIREQYDLDEEDEEEEAEVDTNTVECTVCGKPFEGDSYERACAACAKQAGEYLGNTTSEQIAKDACTALVDELGSPDQWKVPPETFWRKFIEGKGIRRFRLATKLAQKADQAERVFGKMLREQANALLQRLSGELAEWAAAKGRDKVSEAETELFLSEKGQDIRKQSKQVIRTKANQILARGK